MLSLPLLLDERVAYKWIGMGKRREIFDLRIISQHSFLSPRNIAMNKQMELLKKAYRQDYKPALERGSRERDREVIELRT